MTYAKTKDGRIIKTSKRLALYDDNVIKVADNMEDLFDEFVCESNEEGNDFFEAYMTKALMLRDVFWTEGREHYNFYAGVRVKGKGLLYVARLYEDGRFRLL